MHQSASLVSCLSVYIEEKKRKGKTVSDHIPARSCSLTGEEARVDQALLWYRAWALLYNYYHDYNNSTGPCERKVRRVLEAPWPRPTPSFPGMGWDRLALRDIDGDGVGQEMRQMPQSLSVCVATWFVTCYYHSWLPCGITFDAVRDLLILEFVSWSCGPF